MDTIFTATAVMQEVLSGSAGIHRKGRQHLCPASRSTCGDALMCVQVRMYTCTNNMYVYVCGPFATSVAARNRLRPPEHIRHLTIEWLIGAKKWSTFKPPLAASPSMASAQVHRSVCMLTVVP